MAQNVIINGVTYSSVPAVTAPLVSGQGVATFVDTSDANATANSILDGNTAYVDGVKISGNIQRKSAATYTPTTSDQTIAASQYLEGAQTIKGDSNLQSQYIADGVSIFGVAGSLTTPIISQDSTTKILSIS